MKMLLYISPLHDSYYHDSDYDHKYICGIPVYTATTCIVLSILTRSDFTCDVAGVGEINLLIIIL